MEHLVEQFDQIEDPYLRERKADVVQVVERLVKVLLGHPGHLPPKRRDGLGTIVVAHDLSPADTIGFQDHNIAGFVTDIGGPTSHTAIVARSLSIPAVVGLHHIRHLAEEDELLIIDGTRGVAILAPDPQIVQEYRLRRAELELERSKLNRLKDRRATTLDGIEVSNCSQTSKAPRTSARSARSMPTASVCIAPSSCSSAATRCPTRTSSTKRIRRCSRPCRANRSRSAPSTSARTRR
jgi:phosphoenolpyruvate-protein kinase (PTS system EI component)